MTGREGAQESFVRRRLLSNYHQLSSDIGNAKLMVHLRERLERLFRVYKICGITKLKLELFFK